MEAAPKKSSFSQTFTLHSFYCAWYQGCGWTRYTVKDGGMFTFNPNPYDITIKTRLTAVNDPDFEFNDGQTGTYVFEDLVVDGFSDCVSHPGLVGWQMFGPPGIGAIQFDHSAFNETFRLDVWSDDGESYFYGPGDGFGGTGNDTRGPYTFDDAYFAAWSGFDEQIPVTWDSDIDRWVAVYANFLHNDSFWGKGWRTEVTVDQGVAQGTKTYTIRTISQSGRHGHSAPIPSYNCCSNPSESTGCSGNEFNTMCYSFALTTLFDPASRTEDAFRFHINDENKRSWHDGHLTIQTSAGSPSGVTVSVRVYPNSTGTTCN